MKELLDSHETRIGKLESELTNISTQVAKNGTNLEVLIKGLDVKLDTTITFINDKLDQMAVKTNGTSHKFQEYDTKLAKIEATQSAKVNNGKFWKNMGITLALTGLGAVVTKILELVIQ